MQKATWSFLALAEVVLSIFVAQPAILNAIKIANTRKEVLDLNWGYWAGMLFGDAVRVILALLLTWHAIRITGRLFRTRMSRRAGFRG